MAQTLSYSSVVDTGAYWSNGSNVQTDNGVYATCYPGGAFDVTSGWLKIALSNPTDPLDHANHSFTVRAFVSSGTVILVGTAQLEISLREGGIERASMTTGNLTTTETPYTLSPSVSQAAAISNYNNLELWVRCIFNAGSDDARTVSVDYLFGTIPSLVAPGVPTSVAASDGTYADKVRVTWAAPSHSPGSAATSYKVLRDGVQIASGVTGTQYDDTGATPNGVSHSYTVRSTNGAGDSAQSSANTGYRAITDIVVSPSPSSFVLGTVNPTVQITSGVITPAPATFVLSTAGPTVAYNSVPATWREVFGVYHQATDTFNLGILWYRHATLPGESIPGDELIARTDHLVIRVSDGQLTRHAYENTYVSAFASAKLWTSSESGGAVDDRPDTLVFGLWDWGAYPDFYSSPGELLFEVSAPTDETEAYDANGYPDYRPSPASSSVGEKAWVGPSLVFGSDDLGAPGVNKTLRRVTLWVIPSTAAPGAVGVIVEPLTPQANNLVAESISRTRSVPAFSAPAGAPARPVVLVFVDFDPAESPGVSGHATAEAFHVQVNFDDCLGIVRAEFEYEIGGEIALLVFQP